MTSRSMIAFGFCLLLASMSLCDASQSWLMRELRDSHIDEAKSMAYQLIKINNDFRAKLPLTERIKEDLDYIEKEFKGPNCFRSNKKKALKQLASMRSMVNVCDIRSAIGLDTIGAALDQFQGTQYSLERVESIIKHYQTAHSINCGQVYKSKYRESIEKLEQPVQQNIKRVHEAFDGLCPSDFSQLARTNQRLTTEGAPSVARQQVELLMMPDFVLGRDASKAVTGIAREIGHHLLKTEQRNLIDALLTDEAALKKFLDEHLLEPCVQYREKLADVLEPATIVATFSHTRNHWIQELFIAQDQEFLRGMFNFGLCGKVLQEYKELYEYLSASLRAQLS